MRRKKMPTAIILEFLSDLVVIVGVIAGLWYWFNYHNFIFSLGIFFILIVVGFTLRIISNIGDILLKFALDVSPHIKHTIPNQLIQNDIHLIQIRSSLEEVKLNLSQKIGEVIKYMEVSLNKAEGSLEYMKKQLEEMKEPLGEIKGILEEMKEPLKGMEKSLEELKNNISEANSINNEISATLKSIDSQSSEMQDRLSPILSLPEINNSIAELNKKFELIKNFLEEVKKRLDL
jgi:methyl-accepting chemotaxis protein